MSNNFVICIPLHKNFEKLTHIENICINSLLRAIGDKQYNICFITNSEINVDRYESLFSCPIDKLFYDKSYFLSTKTYSQLLVNNKLYSDLYNKYTLSKNVENMFIYQLDAYVVRDEFEKWGDSGFEYIGGPVISNKWDWPEIKRNEKIIPMIGNGGFSMRNIKLFNHITSEEFLNSHDKLRELMSDCKFEDVYFCCNLFNKHYFAKMPSWEAASHFAFDFNPEFLYERNNKELPFAIHGVDKHYSFWKNIIPELKENSAAIDVETTVNNWHIEEI